MNISKNIVTWNPFAKGPAARLSNENLTTYFSTSRSNVVSTIGRSGAGKYYAELTIKTSSNDYFVLGICELSGFASNNWLENSRNAKVVIGHKTENYFWDKENGLYNSNFGTGNFTTGDVIGLKIDLDNRVFKLNKNGYQVGSDVLISDTNKYWAIAAGYHSTGKTGTITANFGAAPFSYELPERYYSFDGSQTPFRCLIQQEHVVKVYKDIWKTIGTFPITLDMINKSQDILAFSRKVSERIKKMNLSTENTTFKHVVNLKHYFDIHSIKIK
ncbi:hypothetical protein [Lysinibacillus pakistanensis]|uniref:hypothetical protein n=1 Tax=Lysinibacillus pakistanensis TaxID=759811 RepID=UPI003D29A161